MSAATSSSGSDDTIGQRVYIGNIPYQATRQQLIDVFSRVGEVASVTIVVDPESGRPKGYGFAVFRDPETCQSAIRNLNNYELHGRALRIDYPEADKAIMKARESGVSVPLTGDRRGVASKKASIIGAASDAVPPTPTADVVQKLIRTFSRAELIDILADMKKFAESNPAAARQLLNESPQLAQAFLQIQLLFGLVSQNDLQQLQMRAHQPPPPQMVGHHHHPPPSHHAAAPPAGPGGHPGGPPPPPPQAGGSAPMGNVLGFNVTQEQLRRLPPDQQKVLEMVFKLTPQQIQTLPAELQKQLYDLKMQLERQI